jgi:L-alanine-DL-glutamate epimerase-like enolase superfamily enzyme
MKITGYRLLTTHHDWRRPIGDVNGFIESGVTAVPLLILDTDEGVTGIGVGSHQDVDKLFPALEGQDPRAVASLYDRMLARVFKAGHSGATFGGIGALDSALWDIKAKLSGEPLWRLLGGADRFVQGYASPLDIALSDEELAAFYEGAVDRGFTSGKLKGGRDLRTDLRRLRIVENALRANTASPGLMLDANESWNLKQAVRYVSRMEEEIDLAWVEEPLRRWDADGHARLSGSVHAAVATGENLTGLEQFRPLFDARGIDIAQTASVWGVTHFLRVAAAAHSRDIPVSPIGLSLNPSVAGAATAVPNHLTAEVQDFGEPFGMTIDQEFVDGGIILGDRPGNGIEINESKIVANQMSATWLAPAGPHVRSPRAGLQLSF